MMLSVDTPMCPSSGRGVPNRWFVRMASASGSEMSIAPMHDVATMLASSPHTSTQMNARNGPLRLSMGSP